MSEISDLLKEAKPLYYERKRFKQRIQKTCMSLFVVFTIFASGYSGYAIKSLTTPDYIASSETLNYITTESFLPVDEYGLITVAY